MFIILIFCTGGLIIIYTALKSERSRKFLDVDSHSELPFRKKINKINNTHAHMNKKYVDYGI